MNTNSNSNTSNSISSINNNINTLKTDFDSNKNDLTSLITTVTNENNNDIKKLERRIEDVDETGNNNIKQIKSLLSQELEGTRWDIAKLQNIVIGPISALNERVTTEVSSIMNIITNTINNDIDDVRYRVTNIESILQGRLDTLQENIQNSVQKPIQVLDQRVTNIEQGVGGRLEIIEKRQLLLSDETTASKKASEDKLAFIEQGFKSRLSEMEIGISKVDKSLENKITEVDQKVRSEILLAAQNLEEIIENQRISIKLRKALISGLAVTSRAGTLVGEKLISIVNNEQAKENRQIVKSSLSSGIEAINSIPKDIIKKLYKKSNE